MWMKQKFVFFWKKKIFYQAKRDTALWPRPNIMHPSVDEFLRKLGGVNRWLFIFGHETNSYLVRVTIGGGTSVLEVAATFFRHISRDPNGAASIGHARGKIMDRRCLMLTRQPPFIVLALVRIICLDVTYMVSGKFINGTFDFRQSVLFTHFQRRKICVSSGTTSCTIPFSLIIFWSILVKYLLTKINDYR